MAQHGAWNRLAAAGHSNCGNTSAHYRTRAPHLSKQVLRARRCPATVPGLLPYSQSAAWPAPACLQPAVRGGSMAGTHVSLKAHSSYKASLRLIQLTAWFQTNPDPCPNVRACAWADGRQAGGQQALSAEHHKQPALTQQARHGGGDEACRGEDGRHTGNAQSCHPCCLHFCRTGTCVRLP